MTNEEYIKRARSVHGDKYDYSRVDYTKMAAKVKIICPVHGEFSQNAQSHLIGRGCPECGREKQKQTMLEKYGVDNAMKSKEICSKARQTCLEKYGSEWAMSCDTVKDKVTATNLSRYGVKRPIQNKAIYEKSINTNLSRYGKKFIGQVDEIRQRAKKTCLERYGTEEPLASNEIREKIKVTNRERYQGNAPMSSFEIRRKCEATVLKRYSVKYSVQSEKVISKIQESKVRNNTFSSSNSEDILYSKLCEVYGEDDIERNYISNLYPYACDFYIISRNMYIELNGLWTHGHRWFNPQTDNSILREWSLKNTSYYNNAIHVWSVSDVEKRECARRNNLNYIVFWDSKLRDADLWFACNCPNAHDYIKEYSWLPERDITQGTDYKFTGTSSNLSRVAKSYQFNVFYKQEIDMWNENALFRNMRLQMWLHCNRYEYLGKLPHELTNNELLRGFTISGIHKGYTIFDSRLMDTVVKKYNIKSIYDPCAGWGERLLYCYNNDIDYYGVDINSELKSGYNRLISDLNITKQHIAFSDSSSFIPKFSAEAVITCPPYGNIEIYSKDGAENLDESDFLKWWEKVVNNSLKTGIKYFCFQINQKWKNKLINVLEKSGFVFEEELHFENNRKSHFTRNKSEFESMIIMKLQ